MQRWSALALVGILIASAMLSLFRVGKTEPVALASSSASPSAAASGGLPPAASASAPPGPAGSALALPDLAALDSEVPAPAKPVDPAPSNLPEGAPKSVTFGVILVEYRGAQGASRTARSRADADALAKGLLEEAKKDFGAAVSKGDPGSMENAGAMPRGILEAAPEQVLFTLGAGEVGGPVDTPRGLWIVKRIE